MKPEEVERQIREGKGVLLYFSGENCQVCHALRPKLEEVFSRYFPLVKQICLDVSEHPEIAARFHVFSVPTMIVFLQGREFVREGRAVSIYALVEKLRRPYEIMTGG
jgi:thioredoxin-like negative regulator of GroEL